VSKAPAPTKQTVARRRNAAERRERILSEGGRALYVLLQPDAAGALASIEAAGHNATATINAMLVQAGKAGWTPEKPAE